MNVKTMINEYVGAMSLAIHEGMDSRGSHDENGEGSVRGSHGTE
jgi:hypothetical protein